MHRKHFMGAIVKAVRRRLLSQDQKAQKHVHGLHDLTEGLM